MKRILQRVKRNGGFSLVELLIAIVILGIAVSPLLHAMVTSAKTAAKSRSLGNATLAAQNLMEGIQAGKISPLLKVADNAALLNGKLSSLYQKYNGVTLGRDANISYQDKNDETVLTKVPDLAAGPVYLKLKDLSAGGEQFEAVIRIDPSNEAYKNINYQEVSSFSPMDILFTQPVSANDGTSEGLTKNPDMAAAAYFALDAMAEGTADLGLGVNSFESYRDYFLKHFAREITIKIDLDERDAGTPNDDVVNLTAVYTYKTYYAYYVQNYDESGNPVGAPVPDIKYPEPFVQDFSFPLSSLAGNVTPSIYFFFYPNMTSLSDGNFSGTNYNESIKIENKKNVDATIFLIKQDPSYPDAGTDTLGYGLTANQAAVKESGYTARVSLYENHASGDIHASVHSNIATKLYSGTGEITVAFQQYHIGTLIYESGRFSGQLVDTVPGMRLYDIQIALYKPGGTEPVYVLEGTKLSPAA